MRHIHTFTKQKRALALITASVSYTLDPKDGIGREGNEWVRDTMALVWNNLPKAVFDRG